MLLRNRGLYVALVCLAVASAGCSIADRPLKLSEDFGKVVRHTRAVQQAYPTPAHHDPELDGVAAKNMVEAYQESFEAAPEETPTPLISINK